MYMLHSLVQHLKNLSSPQGHHAFMQQNTEFATYIGNNGLR